MFAQKSNGKKTSVGQDSTLREDWVHVDEHKAVTCIRMGVSSLKDLDTEYRLFKVEETVNNLCNNCTYQSGGIDPKSC